MEDARIKKAEDAYKILKNYGSRRQEHFLVVTLDSAHHVIKKHVATKGLLNRTIIHPREVFFHAIKDYSAAIIIAHNHPSGNPEPSFEDHQVTKRMKEAGELIGIQVLDHLIISKEGFYSFAENGEL